MSTMNPINSWVILDRDGVVNVESENYIKSPDEWLPIPGSLEAIVRLNHAGFKVIIATNQSGIAKGLFNSQQLLAIHQKLKDQLGVLGGKIDQIFVCPHRDEEKCECRKPQTGLFQQIEAHYQISLQELKVPCIGDSLRDLIAADKMGALPILVLTGHGKKTLLNLPENMKNINYFANLAQAVDHLLKDRLPYPNPNSHANKTRIISHDDH